MFVTGSGNPPVAGEAALPVSVMRNLKKFYGDPFQKFLWTDWTMVAARKL